MGSNGPKPEVLSKEDRDMAIVTVIHPGYLKREYAELLGLKTTQISYRQQKNSLASNGRIRNAWRVIKKTNPRGPGPGP